MEIKLLDDEAVEICLNCGCSRGPISIDDVNVIKNNHAADKAELKIIKGVKVEFVGCLEICRAGEHFNTKLRR